MLQELGYQFPDGWSMPDDIACDDECPTVMARQTDGTS
jgi:hypothetical protein